MEDNPLQIQYIMENNFINILSTRPLSDALITQAGKENVVLEIKEYICTQKMVYPETLNKIKELATQNATIVFTSMNAVEIVAQILSDMQVVPDWNIYCLGGTTLSVIKNIWLNHPIKGTAKNAGELAEKIIADNVDAVHFFCGNIRREELPSILKKQNIKVNEWVVYETLLTPSTIEKVYDGILFFSPSAVESFFSVNQLKGKTVLFAIGTTTENAIKKYTKNKIVTGDFPEKEELVNKAIHYLQTNK